MCRRDRCSIHEVLRGKFRTEPFGGDEGGTAHLERIENLFVYVRREVTARDVLDEELW